MKVALVYDHVNRIGGAERIIRVLHELYPEAPLYCSVYNPDTAGWAKEIEIRTTFLQKIPFAKKFHEYFPGISYIAMESLDFSSFDVVISVTSAEGKSIVTGSNTLNICYCLTPTRYLWSHYFDYFDTKWKQLIVLPFVSILRLYDYIVAQRPDIMVAISETVKSRIETYYKRKSLIIYPPVSLQEFVPGKHPAKDYYLVVSRLVKYKHIEIVIEACNQMQKNLKIAGIGPELNNLRKIAGNTVEFLGNLTDTKLIEYYQDCRALIFAQVEDFGLTQVEALACGRPVIAYKMGAALEIQIEGETGEFFADQTAKSLMKSIKLFETKEYDSDTCRQRVLKFDTMNFLHDFSDLISRELRSKINSL